VVAWVVAAGAGGADASEEGVQLRALDQLQEACREAERPGPRALYVVVVPRFAFATYEEAEGFLPVETGRNLRAFDGAAELFPAELEPMGFPAGPERAGRLQRAARSGARLRVGFFLGLDNRHRSPCLIQSAFGVTTVRMDVAFLDLVGRDGRLLARHRTDRLRGWLDARARDRVPGEGPRGVLREASLSSRPGRVPDRWQQAVMAANRGPLGEAVAECHAAAVERGGAGRGRVVVRVTVDPTRGQVRTAKVELSAVERAGADCVAEAIGRHLRLPPASDLLGVPPVDVSIPVDLEI
jgi:hypothetical protein